MVHFHYTRRKNSLYRDFFIYGIVNTFYIIIDILINNSEFLKHIVTIFVCHFNIFTTRFLRLLKPLERDL